MHHINAFCTFYVLVAFILFNKEDINEEKYVYCNGTVDFCKCLFVK